MGGGKANCSVLEAIEIVEKLTDKKMVTSYNPVARTGDHQWYVSDITKFTDTYDYEPTYDIENTIQEIIDNS